MLRVRMRIALSRRFLYVHTPYYYQYIKDITQNYLKYNYNACSYGVFLLLTQERVPDSRGKGDISVRSTEVLLYFLAGILVPYHVYAIRNNKKPVSPATDGAPVSQWLADLAVPGSIAAGNGLGSHCRVLHKYYPRPDMTGIPLGMIEIHLTSIHK